MKILKINLKTFNFFNYINSFILLLRKAIYLYKYMDEF